MKKLTIKKLIEFKGKGDKAKKNFALAIKQNKPEPKSESGGDYWTIAVSAIAKAYKEKDPKVITEKISEVEEKRGATNNPQVKAQYSKNIELLHKYENFDFKKWTPPGQFGLLKNHHAVLTVKELLIKSTPNVVFRFGKDKPDQVGGIWLVAQKDGF